MVTLNTADGCRVPLSHTQGEVTRPTVRSTSGPPVTDSPWASAPHPHEESGCTTPSRPNPTTRTQLPPVSLLNIHNFRYKNTQGYNRTPHMDPHTETVTGPRTRLRSEVPTL